MKVKEVMKLKWEKEKRREEDKNMIKRKRSRESSHRKIVESRSADWQVQVAVQNRDKSSWSADQDSQADWDSWAKAQEKVELK